MQSYLTHLECTYCKETFSVDEPHRTCRECGKVLYPRYDLKKVRSALDRDMLKDRPANMWRYYEVMPILDERNIVTLGEGLNAATCTSKTRALIPPPPSRPGAFRRPSPKPKS
jgi:threonine synthase